MDISDTDIAIPRLSKKYSPFGLGDILPGQPWPSNIQQLLSDPIGNNAEHNRRLSITEVLAFLCHVGFVEVGFVPHHMNADVKEVLEMEDHERVTKLAKTVDPIGYNPGVSVYSWGYQVVCISEGNKIQEETVIENESEAATEMYFSKTEYQLSSPCSVIMLPSGNHIKIFCNYAGSAFAPAFQHTAEIDIIPFLERSSLPGLETMKLSVPEWMKILNLNGLKFGSWFKKTFAILCLDSMNGIVFEKRGLVCLSPEILVRVLSCCDVQSIRNVRLTCRYLNEVGRIPKLWRILFLRDFGPHPHIVERFGRNSSRVPYTPSESLLDAMRDYKVLYTAQKRSLLRSVSLNGISSRFRNPHGYGLNPYGIMSRPHIFRFSNGLPDLFGFSDKRISFL